MGKRPNILEGDDLIMSPAVFAQMVANGELDLSKLRTNSILRRDEWLSFDQVLLEVARDNLVGIADLQGLGLTRNLGGLGVIIDLWESISDMDDAQVSMDGVTRDEEDGAD